MNFYLCSSVMVMMQLAPPSDTRVTHTTSFCIPVAPAVDATGKAKKGKPLNISNVCGEDWAAFLRIFQEVEPLELTVPAALRDWAFGSVSDERLRSSLIVYDTLKVTPPADHTRHGVCVALTNCLPRGVPSVLTTSRQSWLSRLKKLEHANDPVRTAITKHWVFAIIIMRSCACF